MYPANIASLFLSFLLNSSLDIVNSCTSHEPRGFVMIYAEYLFKVPVEPPNFVMIYEEYLF